MNGIEKITEKILAEAGQDAENVITEAQKQAAEIAEEYRKQAEQEKRTLIERGLLEAEEARRRIASAAALEIRKQKLAEKQELINTAFVQAREKLRQLSPVDYAALLTRFAISNCVSGKEEVLFSAGDRDSIGPHVVKLANEYLTAHGRRGELRISSESGNFDKGLLLREGDIEINCAIPTIVEFMRDGLAPQVAEILFD